VISRAPPHSGQVTQVSASSMRSAAAMRLSVSSISMPATVISGSFLVDLSRLPRGACLPSVGRILDDLETIAKGFDGQILHLSGHLLDYWGRAPLRCRCRGGRNDGPDERRVRDDRGDRATAQHGKVDRVVVCQTVQPAAL